MNTSIRSCLAARRILALSAVSLVAFVAVTTSAEEPPAPEPGRPDPAVIKMVQKAQQLIGQGKLEEAAKLVADEVEKRPKDPNMLIAAATMVQQIAFQYIEDKQDRAKANPHLYSVARYMRRFKKALGGKVPPQAKQFYATAIYNEACSLAVDNKKDEAVKVLKEAIEAGFDEYDVIKDDSDFDSLRKDEKYKATFEKLVEKVKNNKPKTRVRT